MIGKVCTYSCNILTAIHVFEDNEDNTACIPDDQPLSGNAFWTSGQRQTTNDCESPFVWKITSGLEKPFIYTSWEEDGEPICGDGETCVNLVEAASFDWNDHDCNMKICPLCEHKI